MSYPPDPGGVFASDVHRRVMANVPNPDDDPMPADEIRLLRIERDDHLSIGADELDEVLKDLHAAGFVKQFKDGGYRNTAKGFNELTDKGR